MYLLYLDESGGPNSWTIQDHFVLAGIAVHEGQIYSLSKELNDLQAKYFPGSTRPIEFHTTDIRSGNDEYRRLSRTTRKNIIDDVYAIIQKQYFPNVLTFATCLHKSKFANPEQVIYDCFKEVCQNFNLFLYHQHKYRKLTKGLVIVDHGKEEQYLGIFNEFRESAAVEEYLANVVDIPYFAPCSDTRLLQVADFISNAVWRYYERGIDVQMNKINSLFFKTTRYPQCTGLNHLTTDRTCSCYACA